MEQWKEVNGTNGKILVSDKGRVKSLLRDDRILSQQIDNKGYHRIRVTIDGNKMSFKVHRLVAMAFIDNPNNLPQVNHKDGDKNNNSVENLEWVSNIDNAHHAISNGLWESVFEGGRKENERRMKAVVARKGSEEIRFKSISQAERYFNSRHICDVLKGERCHVKGWTFSYAESGVMPNGD